MADALFSALPEANEGDLTRLRAHLVRGETLAALAADMNLGQDIDLGPGELKSGGHRRASIQADAFEALIGAIYLDRGFAATRDVILQVFAQRLKDLPQADSLKDPKTRLQEFLQARGDQRPDYSVVEESGPQHRKHFVVECRVDEHLERGQGSSRRQAEQRAALAMLESLQT